MPRTYTHISEPRNVQKAEKIDTTATQHLETSVTETVQYQSAALVTLPNEFDPFTMSQWTVTANDQPMSYDGGMFQTENNGIIFSFDDVDGYVLLQTIVDPALNITLKITYDKEVVNADIQNAINLAN